MSGTPPDPHPIVTILTRPISNWFRWPVYLVLLAAAGALGYLYLTDHYAAELQSVATSKMIETLRILRKQDTTVLALQKAAQLHLEQGAQHEQAAKAGVISADSAQKLAQAAALAVQQAKTASDSIGGLLRQVGALTGVVGSLRGSLTEQQAATSSALAAYRDARLEADTTERALLTLRRAGQAVVKADECKLVSWHPCLPHVHVGAYLGEQLLPKPQNSIGLAIVWSP